MTHHYSCSFHTCSSRNVTNILFKEFNYVRLLRSNHRRFSVKKGVLKSLPRFTENMCQNLFFDKMYSGTGVSCGFCKIFKNTIFAEHPRATASDHTFVEKKRQHFKQKFWGKIISEIMVLILKKQITLFSYIKGK